MIDRSTFRRENLLLAAALVTFLGTVGVVCYLLFVGNTVTIAQGEIVIASLLAASASWAGIQSWHRVNREGQRSQAQQFMMDLGRGRDRDDIDAGGEQ